MKKFVALSAKTSIHLTEDNGESVQKIFNKKKKKMNSDYYKICSQAFQTDNKISHLEKNKINVKSLIENHEYFIRDNKVILKTQQSKSKRHVFTEEINKIASSSNDDKILQSNDSVETYAYERSNSLLHLKEKIECNNTVKQTIRLTLIILQKKS